MTPTHTHTHTHTQSIPDKLQIQVKKVVTLEDTEISQDTKSTNNEKYWINWTYIKMKNFRL